MSTQSVIRVRIEDETGIDTNRLTLRLGANPPVAFGDSRLAFQSGVLTYTPGADEALGAGGQTLSVAVSAADTLGNESPGAAWTFKLEQPVVLSDRIIQPSGANLTLVSTNGDTFVYRYAGASSGLQVGDKLVEADLRRGYARTVVGLSEDAGAQTVTVLTRPARPGELIAEGSLLSGANFSELTEGPSPHGGGLEDRPGLHLGDFGVHDAQAAAAEAEHGIELVEFFRAHHFRQVLWCILKSPCLWPGS